MNNLVNFTKDKITVYEGSHGYNIQLQALDENGNAFNLTGYTVTWTVKDPQGTTPKFTRACTALDLSDGKVNAPIQSGDWSVGSITYNTQLTATTTTPARVEIFGGLSVRVQEKLAV